MNSYTPTKEFDDAIVQLQTGGGEIVALAAKAGNVHAKTTIDAYQMFYSRPDHASESLFLTALGEFKKSLGSIGAPQEKP